PDGCRLSVFTKSMKLFPVELLPRWFRILASRVSLDGAQLSRLSVRHERHTSFTQNPRLDFGMPHSQQVQRPGAVMLFSGRAGLVALQLCDYTGRTLHPLGKRAKRPA